MPNMNDDREREWGNAEGKFRLQLCVVCLLLWSSSRQGFSESWLHNPEKLFEVSNSLSFFFYLSLTCSTISSFSPRSPPSLSYYHDLFFFFTTTSHVLNHSRPFLMRVMCEIYRVFFLFSCLKKIPVSSLIFFFFFYICVIALLPPPYLEDNTSTHIC